MGNGVITFVISANQHLALTFLTLIFQFQRQGCKLSFLSYPAARAPQRARLQATSYRLYSRYLSCLAKITAVDYEVEQD